MAEGVGFRRAQIRVVPLPEPSCSAEGAPSATMICKVAFPTPLECVELGWPRGWGFGVHG